MSGDQLDLDAIVCNYRWDDNGEPACERHGFLWPDGEEFCNGFDQSERALVAEVRRLRAGRILEERWVPVTESGERWVGRTLEQAEAAMAQYPAGGTYIDGYPWDGITHIEHEQRHVTEWAVIP